MSDRHKIFRKGVIAPFGVQGDPNDANSLPEELFVGWAKAATAPPPSEPRDQVRP